MRPCRSAGSVWGWPQPSRRTGPVPKNGKYASPFKREHPSKHIVLAKDTSPTCTNSGVTEPVKIGLFFWGFFPPEFKLLTTQHHRPETNMASDQRNCPRGRSPYRRSASLLLDERRPRSREGGRASPSPLPAEIPDGHRPHHEGGRGRSDQGRPSTSSRRRSASPPLDERRPRSREGGRASPSPLPAEIPDGHRPHHEGGRGRRLIECLPLAHPDALSCHQPETRAVCR